MQLDMPLYISVFMRQKCYRVGGRCLLISKKNEFKISFGKVGTGFVRLPYIKMQAGTHHNLIALFHLTKSVTL